MLSGASVHDAGVCGRSRPLGRDPVTTFVFGGADLPVGPDEIMRDCDASHDLRPA